MNKKFNLHSLKKVSVLVLLILGISVISVNAEDRIDPFSPIEGISWQQSKDNKSIEVTVALRTIPSTSTDGIPLSLFTLTDINSTAADGRSAPLDKTGKYLIEITSNTGIGNNFRVVPE